MLAIARTVSVPTPVHHWAELDPPLRALLPEHRRDAYVIAILADAIMVSDHCRLVRLVYEYEAPERSLFLGKQSLWDATIEIALPSGLARLGSTGFMPMEQVRAIAARAPGYADQPLPLSKLLPLDALLKLWDASIPEEHRVHPPLSLDVGLVQEAGVPRWRLQYEIRAVGFRVLHLNAITGDVLYDRFDAWEAGKQMPSGQ